MNIGIELIRLSEPRSRCRSPERSKGVIPCLGEKSGDLQRCEVRSASGLGATSCTGLTCTSASFLRHCSLFLIIACMEHSFSVTMKICDWRHTVEGEETVQNQTCDDCLGCRTCSCGVRVASNSRLRMSWLFFRADGALSW